MKRPQITMTMREAAHMIDVDPLVLYLRLAFQGQFTAGGVTVRPLNPSQASVELEKYEEARS